MEISFDLFIIIMERNALAVANNYCVFETEKSRKKT